jgi:hypothetical protein
VKDTISNPPHQASAIHPLLPSGVPVRKLRTVSITGVIGWCSLIGRRNRGIVSGWTNALLRYGRNSMKKLRVLADSIDFAITPRPAASKDSATPTSTSASSST